jgi:ADP-heptose:LPS heptosyltransferase
VLTGLAGPRLLDLVGDLHLLAVYAVLTRCTLFVGNDSGLMHMAAAAGIPTVGLFGPSRDDHYAPWGPLGRVVRTDEPYATLFPPDLDPATVTESRMGSLPVSRAVEAAATLLRAAAPSAADRA